MLVFDFKMFKMLEASFPGLKMFPSWLLVEVKMFYIACVEIIQKEVNHQTVITIFQNHGGKVFYQDLCKALNTASIRFKKLRRFLQKYYSHNIPTSLLFEKIRKFWITFCQKFLLHFIKLYFYACILVAALSFFW